MKKIMKRLFSTLLALTVLITSAPSSFVKAAASAAPESSGYSITFGSYPQTKVIDSSLIADLNSQTLSADNTVTYNDSKYKKVYFTTKTNWDQGHNGYNINTVYWFKYEPIEWRVLTNSNGELFLMAEKILDAKVYNSDQTSVTWETCTMRTWLNNDFYNTAFTETEKAQIITSNVVNEDNPWNNTEGGNNTTDKLFLLSYTDTVNTAYGFSLSYDTYDAARQSYGTEFAKCSGLNVYQGDTYYGNSFWWLRSPGFSSFEAGVVSFYGRSGDYSCGVSDTEIGVRPVCRLSMNLDIFPSVESKTDSIVALAWNDIESATGYNVYNGSTKVNELPITATMYSVTGLTHNSVYSFTVKALNAGGEFSVSYPLRVTTKTNAPTGLISPGKTANSVDLSWSLVTGATSYNVYNGLTKVNTVPITATAYTVTGLAQNTAYTFTVKAVNSGGESAASDAVNVTTNEITALAAPTGLTSPDKTSNSVDLSWDLVADATGYNIYNGSIKINIAPITATTYTVTGLAENTAYSFKVKAVNSGIESAASDAVDVTTKDITALAAPTGLTSPSKTADSVDLSWNLVTGATGYNIYNGSMKINIAPITATTYTVTGLAQNTTYYFKVKAVNSGGESAASDPLSVTTGVGYVPGNTIFFGTYPQTEVTDSSLISALNACPLSTDNTVDYGGAKYKRVYFTQYTPAFIEGFTEWPTPDIVYCQKDNGYFINTVYWFKFEPIEWRVLSNNNGDLLVMSENILDSKVFSPGVITGMKWETSSLRSWLNGSFYSSAFSNTEKAQINTSTVSNDGGNTSYDKVFLLSNSDVINSSYGFNVNYGTEDTARRAKGTDFAKSSGLFVDTANPYSGYSGWWLRTSVFATDQSGMVNNYGKTIFLSTPSDVSSIGARPVLSINSSHAESLSVTLAVDEIYKLTTAASPNNALYYESTDSNVAAVDDTGSITAVNTGTAVIRVIGSDGGVVNHCDVTVQNNKITVNENGGLLIDNSNKFFTGVVDGVVYVSDIRHKIDNTNLRFFNIYGNILQDSSTVGTGTRVQLLNNSGTVLDELTIIKFGDVNGDGNIDATDADTCVDVQNWVVKWNRDKEKYKYMAGDINGDGNVDVIDADLIMEASNWRMQIDQTSGVATINN